MSEHVVLLSIPALRGQDLQRMPRLAARFSDGDRAALVPGFPAVTLPVETCMTTGTPPAEHGVVANGFYWRERHEVEMWTAWNQVVERPHLWDRLHTHDPAITSAVWFPMLMKGCGADYVCTPAPIHNPDGSESLWCYTKPELLYGELRDALGHFPLQHFWGPIAGIQSSAWIVASAVYAAERFRPNFFYVYLPHLDYATQKHGPDSPEAHQACAALDAELGRLFDGFARAYGEHEPLWLAASEYAVTPVHRALYPNRTLRAAGLLEVTRDADGREQIDLERSRAWAMCDHQLAHVYVRDGADVARVAALFEGAPGVDVALHGEGREPYGLHHPRAGEVILGAEPDTWFAYYWWTDDAMAPAFARTVDIHRKPGFDPVELFFDPATRGVPLDATLVRGSHGAVPRDERQHGVLLSSERGVFVERPHADVDVAELVLRQFGV